MNRLLILLMVLTALMSCTVGDPKDPDFDLDTSMTGTDQDMHGCIASAGFLWCAKTGECERPNELAKAQSFENNEEAFNQYCAVEGTNPL